MPNIRMGMVPLAVAAVHFAASLFIMPVTMALTESAAMVSGGPGLVVTLLVRLTRLLHFPLLTLALFPREWFPGNWVYVPMALNSSIWAFGIYGLMALFRKSR